MTRSVGQVSPMLFQYNRTLFVKKLSFSYFTQKLCYYLLYFLFVCKSFYNLLGMQVIMQVVIYLFELLLDCHDGQICCCLLKQLSIIAFQNVNVVYFRDVLFHIPSLTIAFTSTDPKGQISVAITSFHFLFNTACFTLHP